MRGRSYSPSPPRGRGGGYNRRRRSPSPRLRHSRHSRDLSTSLLVRNLRHDCRPDDLRRPFGKFGPLKDIYLPRDYYTGAPRGFGFVQFVDPDDAADAKYQMDGQVFQGRELTVVFAEENRKKPLEMRSRERSSHRSRHGRRRSPARYSRSRSPRHSRSPPARRERSRSRSYSPSPKRRRHSRSGTPKNRRPSRERSYSRESGGRSYSRSPPPRNSRSRSRSQSSGRGESGSRSPYPEEHGMEQKKERSASEDGM
ncbi:serine/arginine-rich SC35-like splicing factor SCL30A isoform X2 [Silene latifolia]|uniref:serine/arginine-rich SC35-like splicing factor SCL30A isoform X2 n=1 Tax=Silene latifolia TaxID=37657 RepID=UPI003D77F29A